MSSITLVLAAALSTAATPSTPEELGAVTSAIAFTDVCGSLKSAPTKRDGATDGDLAMMSVVNEFCKGMVVSAVTTMGMADRFTIDGKEVCISPSLSVDAVVEQMGRQIEGNRTAYEGRPLPDIQTPKAIVLAVQGLSTCAPGR